MDGSLQLPVGNRVGLSAMTSIYTALYSCDTWQSAVRHASIGVLDSRALFRPELRTAARSTHHDTCWQGAVASSLRIHITNSVDSRLSLQTFAEVAEPFFQQRDWRRTAYDGISSFIPKTRIPPVPSLGTVLQASPIWAATQSMILFNNLG